jgi:hypothetical protein
MLDPKPKALKFERTRLKPSFRKPPNKFLHVKSGTGDSLQRKNHTTLDQTLTRG